MTLMTSTKMRKMIESWEGNELKAYRDSVGVLTIGFGHTGSDVHEGQVITQAQADDLLTNDLHKFEVSVVNLIGPTGATQNQFDALVSFAYNLGAGALSGSTLLKLHKQGQFAEAAAQFKQWDHAGGRVLPGLLRRRTGEAGVYLNSLYS